MKNQGSKENIRYLFDKTRERIKALYDEVETINEFAFSCDYEVDGEDDDYADDFILSLMGVMDEFVNNNSIYRAIEYNDQFGAMVYNPDIVIEMIKKQDEAQKNKNDEMEQMTKELHNLCSGYFVFWEALSKLKNGFNVNDAAKEFRHTGEKDLFIINGMLDRLVLLSETTMLDVCYKHGDRYFIDVAMLVCATSNDFE